MISPIVAVCSDPECVNNANSKQTPCCVVCGKCGDHSHASCESLDNTVHGNPNWSPQ